MSTFTVTHEGTARTVSERSLNIDFNDDNSLRKLSAVGAIPTIGGEIQRSHDISQARAVAILQAAGLTGPQITTFANNLRLLIREGILDGYDDARTP